VGSHARYEAAYVRADGTEGRVATAVAMHPGDIPTGTLHKVEKDMDPAFGKGWLR
jgi:predicted RNA binding protein YcfA (HicA-like mRNA interferase family)